MVTADVRNDKYEMNHWRKRENIPNELERRGSMSKSSMVSKQQSDHEKISKILVGERVFYRWYRYCALTADIILFGLSLQGLTMCGVQ